MPQQLPLQNKPASPCLNIGNFRLFCLKPTLAFANLCFLPSDGTFGGRDASKILISIGALPFQSRSCSFPYPSPFQAGEISFSFPLSAPAGTIFTRGITLNAHQKLGHHNQLVFCYL